MPTFADEHLELRELIDRDQGRCEAVYTLRKFIPNGQPDRVWSDSIRFDSSPGGVRVKALLGQVIAPGVMLPSGEFYPFLGATDSPKAGLPGALPGGPVPPPMTRTASETGVQARLTEMSSRRELFSQFSGTSQGQNVQIEVWHELRNILSPGYGNGPFLEPQRFEYYVPESETWQFQFRNRDTALFPSLFGSLPEGASIGSLLLTGWNGQPLVLEIQLGENIVDVFLMSAEGVLLAAGSVPIEDQPATITLEAAGDSPISGSMQVNGFVVQGEPVVLDVLGCGHMIILHVLGVRLG